jgi:hypothetical protein
METAKILLLLRRKVVLEEKDSCSSSSSSFQQKLSPIIRPVRNVVKSKWKRELSDQEKRISSLQKSVKSKDAILLTRGKWKVPIKPTDDSRNFEDIFYSEANKLERGIMRCGKKRK